MRTSWVSILAPLLALTLMCGCSLFREQDPQESAARRNDSRTPSRQSTPRLEETWGPGELATLLTGTFTSKDRNFWFNLPLVSWYVREEDRKGGAILGGLIAYDMVTVSRHQGRPESKQLTSVGFFGLAGNIEKRMLDGSRGFRNHHWLFPIYRYSNIEGKRTVYPLFIFPVQLRDEPMPMDYDPEGLAMQQPYPIDPPDVVAEPPHDLTSQLIDPPSRSTGRSVDGREKGDAGDHEIRQTDDNTASGRWRPVPTSGRSDSAPIPSTSGSGRGQPETSPPSGEATAKPKPRLYTIQQGDTLFQIAKRFYGRGGEWKRIYEHNRSRLTSADRLPAGVQIELP